MYRSRATWRGAWERLGLESIDTSPLATRFLEGFQHNRLDCGWKQGAVAVADEMCALCMHSPQLRDWILCVAADWTLLCGQLSDQEGLLA